jgi:hypothetical protein
VAPRAAIATAADEDLWVVLAMVDDMKTSMDRPRAILSRLGFTMVRALFR